MKSNLLLILLASAITLLAVNLMQGRFPPTAQAAFGGNSWLLGCPGQGLFCYAVSDAGEVFIVGVKNSRYVTTLKR